MLNALERTRKCLQTYMNVYGKLTLIIPAEITSSAKRLSATVLAVTAQLLPRPVVPEFTPSQMRNIVNGARLLMFGTVKSSFMEEQFFGVMGSAC